MNRWGILIDMISCQAAVVVGISSFVRREKIRISQ